MKVFFYQGAKIKVGLALLGLLIFGLVASAVVPQGLLASGQQQRLVPIYEVATEQPQVAISFDASWGAEHTEDILDLLDSYGVKGTFFLVNIWLEDYPELAREIAERGHEIGLHSATHPHFSELSAAQMDEELAANAAMIEEITGYQPQLFRPPFGDYNNQVIEQAAAAGYQSVQWSVETLV